MRTNEEQLELFADLLEPASQFLADATFLKMLQSGDKPIKAAAYAIKKHKSAVIEILALLDGVEPGAYKVPGPLVLGAKVMSFLNSQEAKELFMSQGQNEASATSGSAMEITGAGEA